MKRITPCDIYLNKPCSVVALGSALGMSDEKAIKALYSEELDGSGYLSLKGMNRLVRKFLKVKRQEKFKRGERPSLRDYVHEHIGIKAIICVYGHYVYYDGKNYHSFLYNGNDDVVSVWILNEN